MCLTRASSNGEMYTWPHMRICQYIVALELRNGSKLNNHFFELNRLTNYLQVCLRRQPQTTSVPQHLSHCNNLFLVKIGLQPQPYPFKITLNPRNNLILWWREHCLEPFKLHKNTNMTWQAGEGRHWSHLVPWEHDNRCPLHPLHDLGCSWKKEMSAIYFVWVES